MICDFILVLQYGICSQRNQIYADKKVGQEQNTASSGVFWHRGSHGSSHTNPTRSVVNVGF